LTLPYSRGGINIRIRNDLEEEEERPTQKKVGGWKIEVTIKFAAKVDMSAIQEVLSGMGDEWATARSQDALRVLDIMLREHAATR
jgi:hypothetical protein